jgi:inosine/xanthosine triphosphatase
VSVRSGVSLIVLGSSNPAKLLAVSRAAGHAFPGAKVRGVDVPSAVAAQPLSDVETLRGAEARARVAMEMHPADFTVGVESGVATFEGRLYGFTWVAVLSPEGEFGRGCSARIELPEAVVERVSRGMSLEEALIATGGAPGIGRAGGAMGLLTGGAVTRADATVHALHFAFSRFSGADTAGE